MFYIYSYMKTENECVWDANWYKITFKQILNTALSPLVVSNPFNIEISFFEKMARFYDEIVVVFKLNPSVNAIFDQSSWTGLCQWKFCSALLGNQFYIKIFIRENRRTIKRIKRCNKFDEELFSFIATPGIVICILSSFGLSWLNHALSSARVIYSQLFYLVESLVYLIYHIFYLLILNLFLYSKNGKYIDQSRFRRWRACIK